jgi:hypothetical protein
MSYTFKRLPSAKRSNMKVSKDSKGFRQWGITVGIAEFFGLFPLSGILKN